MWPSFSEDSTVDELLGPSMAGDGDGARVDIDEDAREPDTGDAPADAEVEEAVGAEDLIPDILESWPALEQALPAEDCADDADG